MGKRTNFSDIVALAILFVNKKNPLVSMISYEKVKNFDEAINKNLDEMNSKIFASFFREEESDLYFTATNENGDVCLVIYPNIDVKSAINDHLAILPTDVLVAAEKENALLTLGLKQIE